MADYQRVVEYLRDVRASLGAGTTLVTEELRQSATAYAELCTQANERLRKCSAFLQQGLRSEAIHLAEENPNLLDLVAALDLPDPAQWAEFCQMNELPLPPVLQMDRAQQLDEAYAADQPLEMLLHQHRYLALARAPIRHRLAVLRQIAAQDTANQNWERDVRVFEKARLKELPASFYLAVKNKDAAMIAELQGEVNESPWLEELPKDLSTAVTDAWERVRRVRAETKLQPLVEPLRAAFAARDYDECVRIIGEWKAIMEAANITTCATELAHQVQPVVEWIRQEDELQARRKRFTHACDAVVRLLDSNAGSTDLEAAFERLKKYDEPVPEDLTQRYEQRLVEHQRQAQRAHRLRIVGVAAGVVIVLSLAGGGAYFIMNLNKEERVATEIRAVISTRDVDQMRQRLEAIRASAGPVIAAPKVTAAIAEIDAMEARHKAALERLEQGIKLLGEAKAAAAPVADNPSAAAPDLLRAANATAAALSPPAEDDLTWEDKRGRALAAGLRAARSEVGALHTRLLQRANAIVKGEADKLLGELDALTLGASLDGRTMLTRINEKSERLAQLRNITGVDAEAAKALEAVQTRIEEKRKVAEAASRLGEHLERVRQAQSADRLKAALEAFNTAFPDHALASEFKQALASTPTAKSVEAYVAIAGPWINNNPGQRFFPTTAAAAQKRLDEVQNYLTSNPASPLTGALNQYADYLRHMIDALSESGSWAAGADDKYGNPLLADLKYVETSDKQRYYLLRDPKYINRTINGQRSVSFQVMDPRNPSRTIGVEVNHPIAVLNDGKALPVPHVKVVQEILTEIKRVDERNWETWGIDTLDRLLINAELDPVVKAILVSYILQSQQAVLGPVLADIYEKPQRELKRLEPEKQVWYDREKPVPETIRKAIKNVLDSIPRSEGARKALAARKEALSKALGFLPDGTGVLLRDESGAYLVVANGGNHAGNFAYAVTPPAAGAAAAPASAPASTQLGVSVPESNPALFTTSSSAGGLVKIAAFVNDKWQPVPGAPRDLPQGTMLFMAR